MNYYPNQGWQPPPQMGWQPPYPVFVPTPDRSGRPPSGKSLKKQFREWTEMVELMKGGKKDDPKKDDKGGELKMSPITFFMWLWGLAIPIAALECVVVLSAGKYIAAMFVK